MNLVRPRTVLAFLLLTSLTSSCVITARRAEPRDGFTGVRSVRPVVEAPEGSVDRSSAEAVLNALHVFASEANGERYFELFAPGAVFFGTDATERWSVEEFRAYAEPFFSEGRGWTYTPKERHVYVSDNGAIAWFDERLWNEKYGECRGTGVLRKYAGTWRIAQYNLTIPIPNALAATVVEMIRAEE